MSTLLIAATPAEIQPFLEHLRTRETSWDVDVLITGVGLTATTYHLSKQVSMKRPSLVVQAGIAGCFDRQIARGTVVVVKKDTLADQGVLEKKKWQNLFAMGLVHGNQPPYSNGWLENHTALLKKMKLKKVNGISVNEITTSKQRIDSYKVSLKAAVESMEGAALHYTCLMEDIPFIQLRGVSNYVGDRNKKNWNLKLSIGNLNKELIKLFMMLQN